MDCCLTWASAHLAQIVAILLPITMPLIVFQLLPLVVVMERRGAAFIQDRIGPHRAGLHLQLSSVKGVFTGEAGGLRLRAFGLIYNLTDIVKGLFKEDFVPPFANKPWYLIAPIIPVVIGILATAVLPWFAPFTTAYGQTVSGQIFAPEVGLLLLFALSSLSVYGIVLGSWASNSKYSLLGGMRASAMLISYEVSMGLAILGMLLIVGSFSLTDVVEWQANHTWGIVVQPVGFLLFLVSMFAETCRTPFDVTEGDSEIVGGFHTEYAGIRFMLFMSGEYFHILVASTLIATLFLGGYQLLPVPGFGTAWLKANLPLVVCGFTTITAIGLFVAVKLILGRRAHWAKRNSTDTALRVREYSFYATVLSLAAVGALALGIAVAALWHPQPVSGTIAAGTAIWPNSVNIVTAILQIHILLGKALLLAGLFVWVRWTVPRFRYDQIMGLGWKVMLNVALVNLVLTAVIAKLVKGG